MEASAFGRSSYGGHEEEETKPDTMKKLEQLSNHLLHHQALKEEQLIESARAEMGEVREENQRLKQYLDQVMRDYKTLQTQFINTVNKNDKTAASLTLTENDRETELVSLSLGRSPGSRVDESVKEDHDRKKTRGSSKEDEEEEEGLRLGLDCKFEVSGSGTSESLPKPSPTTSTSSFGEAKEGEVGVRPILPQSKGLKTVRTAAEDHEISNNAQAKRARVSVRTRCDTPTMNDGCQWRKYGQKTAKGNPCPRAYYRCTVAPSCPVRKQVQRCAEDMSILITTYEGTHNHPLPMSATAMVSTTSAAAQMLLSGSSFPSLSSGSKPVTDLHGLNSFGDQYLKPFHPSTSISSSSSCPTITLDLTASNPSSSSSSTHFTRFNPSSYNRFSLPARPCSSTSLSFNSINSSDQNPRSSPFSWPLNITNGGLINNYGQNTQLYGKSQETSSLYHPDNSSSSNGPSLRNQQDTIAAATKAITADPSFQSALAAALKLIINNGGGSGEGSGNHRAAQ